MSPREEPAGNPEMTPALATWLGWQAARYSRIVEGRRLLSAEMWPPYDIGLSLPEDMSVLCPGGDSVRRRWLRKLGGEAVPDRREPAVQALAARIVSATRRQDVGTATRYDVTLRKGDRVVELRDLRAADLLSWQALRPIALDCGIALPPLVRGQGKLWMQEVENALEDARTVPLAADESDAGEIIVLLEDLTRHAREWQWSEDEPYPVGIRKIIHHANVGWPRGIVQKEIRAELGRVSRVAAARARRHLGWVEAEWKIETASIRVWCRPGTAEEVLG